MFRSLVISLSVLCVVPAAAQAAEPRWTTTGPIGFDRYSAASARVAGDDVLLIGGRESGYPQPLASVERYDAETGRWEPTGSLRIARNSASAVELANGAVLVAGGEPRPLEYHRSTEVYHASPGGWGSGPEMVSERSAFALERLPDGDVLAVGGWNNLDAEHGAERLDLSTGKWALTGEVDHVRADPGVESLEDGRVLVAGGWTSGGIWSPGATYHNSAEVYDPATDEWSAIAPMHERRMAPVAARLPDGRILVAGGNRNGVAPDFVPVYIATYEIYDPEPDTWTAPQALTRPRAGAQLVTLSDGRLVLVGGGGPSFHENTAEIYDPERDRWTATPNLRGRRASHIAVALSDDTVLVASGFAAGVLSERLMFDGVPTTTPTPTPTATATATPTPTPVVAEATPTPQAAPPKPGVGAVTVPKRLQASKAGVVSLRVRCTGETACRERLTLRVRGSKVLGRADVALAAGATRTVRIVLKRADRRNRTLKVTVVFAGASYHRTLQMR